MNEQWVFLSREAKGIYAKRLGHEPDLTEMKILFGGKGAGLAEMMAAGAPVPPSFTITTEACVHYMKTGDFPEGMWEQTLAALHELEVQFGRTFGKGLNPLLVSVRSGARKSMPGMMDSVLNLGLNDQTRAAIAEMYDNEWFSYDAYRRLITMFSDVVMDFKRTHFEHKLKLLKQKEGVRGDTEISLQGLKTLVDEYKAMYREHFGEDFPADPYKQLEMSIKAVFNSWNGERAVIYREHKGIPHDWGTAVNVCMMVFGNLGNTSATGVAFSRSPATGNPKLYGEFLINAQGEDVVAGIRTPQKITLVASRQWAAENDVSEEERQAKFPSLEEVLPETYQQFAVIARQMETHYRDMQDMEFTIENGVLWMLQTRDGERTALAAVKTAVDLAKEGLITKEEAILRIEPELVDMLLRPTFDPDAKREKIAKGLNASPGAAVGIAVFDAKRAKTVAVDGEDVILVRPETSPEDMGGMLVSKGVLTQKGGATSHAAVVARGNNIPCVTGCEEIAVDINRMQFTIGDLVIKEGDTISINGFTGEIFLGAVPLVQAKYEEQTDLLTLLSWADEVRQIGVRANADIGVDAERAIAFGAEGIGLCRTEHMFFDPRARDAVVRMILAKEQSVRDAALEEMLPFQEQDFEDLFDAMDGKPVIMRLIDPPMHEFLPPYHELLEEVVKLRITAPDSGELKEKEILLEAVSGMWEVNPMMGLRGCRAGIMYPGLTEMQTRAYTLAACRCAKRGIDVHPEVMIPLVGHVNELKLERAKLERVAKEVMAEEGIQVPMLFGTMIEVPRAALTSDEIAPYAQFFSFGTNDLTQMTYGYSRDDAEGKFLLKYVETGILPENPFQALDQIGVGKLMRLCIDQAKAVNPDLELGICGEHGGDPASIDFCYRVGLDYVSCSPFRVPVARLAAAQATLRNGRRR
ncbi:MAG: pyruvate, phosphate dikinase [Anaerolineae bacterium]|nr:pyruvate, phosphate dikinase [Anaerolineae bacterium]